MNADHDAQTDERFADLLAACDAALATGDAAPTSAAEVTLDLGPRLARGQACLQILERIWPRHVGAAWEQPKRLGRFEILNEIGRGGFGIVFRAFDPSLGRDVALKVPRADVLAAPEMRERFHQEARAAAGLDHPGIVAVYEAGEVGPICYIASAYCPGVTLGAWMREQFEPITVNLAARLIADLADAVQHAHSKGIIHRDLKPANVLLQGQESRVEGRGPEEDSESPFSGSRLSTLDSRPRITDFGLAKEWLPEGTVAGPCRTRSGVVLGTPAYMAPEQAGGKNGAIGPPADIYALGAILYELLTGRPPHQGETDLETLLQVREKEPAAPSRLRPKIPRDLETICLKCLHKEPEKRYASAGALADDVRRFCAGEPIQARPIGTLDRMRRWCRKRPIVTCLLGTLAVAIAGGLGGMSYFWSLAEVRGADAIERRKDLQRERIATKEENERDLQSARRLADRLTHLSDELVNHPQTETVRQQALDEALRFYKSALRDKSADPAVRFETARACVRAGMLQDNLGQRTEAAQTIRDGIALLTTLVEQDKTSSEFRFELAVAEAQLGHVLRNLREFAKSNKAYESALARTETLLKESPGVVTYEACLANTLINQCSVLRSQLRWDDAENRYERALDMLRNIVAANPQEPWRHTELAIALEGLGSLLSRKHGRLAEAEKLCREALTIRERDFHQQPGALERYYLACCHKNLASVLKRLCRRSESAQAYRTAEQHLTTLTQEFPLRTDFHDALTQTRDRLSSLRQPSKIEAIAEGYRRRLVREPNNADAYNSLAWALLKQTDLPRTHPAEALDLAQKAVDINPKLNNAWATLGIARYRDGDWLGAKLALEKSLELGITAKNRVFFYLSMAQWDLGDKQDARASFAKAVALMGDNNSSSELRDLRAQAEKLIGEL